MQLQADALGKRIERPHDIESTALGAAMMAGLGAGIWRDPDELSTIRETDKVFVPAVAAKDRKARWRTWRKAVKRARNWATD
jgi:glycerol kinase